MPNSVGLNAARDAAQRRLAHPSGRTMSDAVREAHLRLSRQHEALEPADRPCVLISDLVGIALDGPDDLARTGHDLHLNKGAMK